MYIKKRGELVQRKRELEKKAEHLEQELLAFSKFAEHDVQKCSQKLSEILIFKNKSQFNALERLKQEEIKELRTEIFSLQNKIDWYSESIKYNYSIKIAAVIVLIAMFSCFFLPTFNIDGSPGLTSATAINSTDAAIVTSEENKGIFHFLEKYQNDKDSMTGAVIGLQIEKKFSADEIRKDLIYIPAVVMPEKKIIEPETVTELSIINESPLINENINLIPEPNAIAYNNKIAHNLTIYNQSNMIDYSSFNNKYTITEITYCNGNYTSGDWIIDTTITCSNEMINVSGSITIQDNSEMAVVQFNTAPNAAYDLRGNSTFIDSAIPDLDSSTPAEYTNDWNPDANHIFKIVMNETEHKIQIYANDMTTMWGYLIKIDDVDASGLTLFGDAGYDAAIVFDAPDFWVGCFNETYDDFQEMPNDGGICDNTYDPDLTRNVSVWWNISSDNTMIETVFEITGIWIDHKIASVDLDAFTGKYTIFKNSAVLGGGGGNLTLRNITLNLQENFTISSILNVNDSKITFLTDNTQFRFDLGSNGLIYNTNMTSNNSTHRYSFYVAASNFTFENGFVDNVGNTLMPSDYTWSASGIVVDANNIIIRNISFGGNLGLNDNCVFVYGSNNLIENITCNATSWSGADVFKGSGNIVRNSILMHTGAIASGDIPYDNLFEGNDVYWRLVVSPDWYWGGKSNTFLNNNLHSAQILDGNNTYNNWFIYNNSYGEIKLYKNNFSITSNVNFSIGTNVYIQDNLLGLADNSIFTNFNVSVELKFYGLTWLNGTAQLLKNGVRCDDTDECNISYDNLTGILYANVSSFSNYTTTGTLPTPTYCNGNYTSGDWIIDTTITCSDEMINVSGSITIQDNSEMAVVQFNTAPNAAYDLRGNSTFIDSAIPDLDSSTPAEYTNDWNPDANHIFKIVMNETEHKIQIFTNNSDSQTKVYFFDLDNLEASGGEGGQDLVVGYSVDDGGLIIACYNSTLDDFNILNLTSNPSAQETCGNAAGYDENFISNFTIYWNNSGNAIELVVDQLGSWIDKKVKIIEAITTYTKFKNSLVIISEVGNLTLRNVTLNIQNNFTVDINSLLNINSSIINFTANNTWFSFNTDANVVINNTNIITNNSSFSYIFYVATNNFILENSFVDNLGTHPESYEGIILAGTGGVINNITIGSNTSIRCIDISGGNNIIKNSNCYAFSYQTIRIWGGDDNILYNNLIGSIDITVDGYSNHIENNTIYNSIGVSGPYGAGYNNTFVNNILDFGTITDTNNTNNNYFIYNNSYGEIKWYRNNFSIANPVNLSIGNRIFIENNLVGLADDSNLANFNVSAELKFYGLSYSRTPYLLKAGVRCDNTNTCNISYNAISGILYANVSSFSNYTTQANPSPLWSSNQTGIVTTYSPTTQSYFNITWQDDDFISVVYIESNYSGTAANYSMNNITLTIYNYSVILPAGMHYWKSYANDSSDEWNESDQWHFSIAKAVPTLNLYINGSTNDFRQNITFNTNITCILTTPNSGNLTIYENGIVLNSTIGSEATILKNYISTSDYNITCSLSNCQNYTDTLDQSWINATTENNLPIHNTPILNATAYQNRTTHNLTVYNQSTADMDGDDVKNIYNWKSNGSSIALLNMPFEGINLTTTNNAYDYSGYGSRGTEKGGVVWNTSGGYDGKGAYEFDGVNDYIVPVPANQLNITGNFTITAWVNKKGKSSSNIHSIFAIDGSTQRSFILGIATTNRTQLWVFRNDSYPDYSVVQGNTALQENRWYHVAATYQYITNGTSRMNLYINGVNNTAEVTNAAGPIQKGIREPRIGARSFTGYEGYFNGSIDEVMIFNRTLSREQIFAIYNNKTNEIVSNETIKNDVWQACITPNDGSGDGETLCSNNITILNSLPEAAITITPANQTTTTNRTPIFVWNNSADDDNEVLTYRLEVDDSITFNNPEINVSSIPEGGNGINTTYYPTTELAVDTTYFWRVFANDTDGREGSPSVIRNFTIESYLAVSVLTGLVAFGTLNQGAAENTTDGTPAPFRVENAGNINMNFTITATRYFTSADFPSEYYLYKIRENSSESGSFDTALSAMTYLNMPAASSSVDVSELNWRDVNDEFLMDINITLPNDEPSGKKTSTVTFTGTGSNTG